MDLREKRKSPCPRCRCNVFWHFGEWRCETCSYSAPREILPGSCWRRKGGKLVGVSHVGGEIRVLFMDGILCVYGKSPSWYWPETDFRAAFTWEADPGEKS